MPSIREPPASNPLRCSRRQRSSMHVATRRATGPSDRGSMARKSAPQPPQMGVLAAAGAAAAGRVAAAADHRCRRGGQGRAHLAGRHVIGHPPRAAGGAAIHRRPGRQIGPIPRSSSGGAPWLAELAPPLRMTSTPGTNLAQPNQVRADCDHARQYPAGPLQPHRAVYEFSSPPPEVPTARKVCCGVTILPRRSQYAKSNGCTMPISRPADGYITIIPERGTTL